MKKVKKFTLLALAVVLMLCVLAGCGAVISTEMTVNKNFAGKRVISVEVSQSDLDDNVTGGIKALKKVATSNLPKQMKCAVSSDSDGSTLTFTISFTDIDDYREKVKKIIAAGSNTDLIPEVTYENTDTVFKKGVQFKENFTSFDLLQWYFDALQEAEIITHSTTSQWYEMGSSMITIDKTDYDTGSAMSVSEQELCCLDGIDVETYLNIDGSFKRVFIFKATDSKLEELSEKGCTLKDYLSKLVPEGGVFEADEEETTNTYTVTVEAKDTAELIKKTDAVLQSKNEFSVKITADKENPGTADIALTEKLDGSYYLSYDYGSYLNSKMYLYDNVSLVSQESGQTANLSDDVLSYSPSASNAATFNLDWKISFKSVEIVSEISSAKKAAVDFVFTSEETLADELKKAAVGALKDACGEVGDFSESGDVSTISFAGTIEEITAKINNFIKFNDPNASENKTYFEIDFAEAETAPKLTNSFCGEIAYDLSPIIGNTRVLFNDNEGLFTDYYYQGSFTTDENGDKTAASSDTVSFTLVKTSVVVLILLAVFILAFIAGVVLAVLQRKNIIAFFKGISFKKKPASVEEGALPAEEPSEEAVAEFAELAEDEAELAAEDGADSEEEVREVEPETEISAEEGAELVTTANAAVDPEEDEEEELL